MTRRKRARTEPIRLPGWSSACANIGDRTEAHRDAFEFRQMRARLPHHRLRQAGERGDLQAEAAVGQACPSPLMR